MHSAVSGTLCLKKCYTVIINYCYYLNVVFDTGSVGLKMYDSEFGGLVDHLAISTVF